MSMLSPSVLPMGLEDLMKDGEELELEELEELACCSMRATCASCHSWLLIS